MKKSIAFMGGIALSLFFVTAGAQQPVQPQPQQKTWDAKNNPTVTAITSQYEGKLIAPRPAMTTEQIFPVLGQYQSQTNADAANITISIDADNKGLVWIEGLPQGRVKAMLRRSPATYKIPAQTTEDGKEVAEGTLIYDKDANTLNIIIGKPYNADDPAMAFAPATEETPAAEEVVKAKTKGKTSKTKTKKVAAPKPWTYTGTKIESTITTNQ